MASNSSRNEQLALNGYKHKYFVIRIITVMKILFVCSEVYPLAKVGGLADVASALPKALRKLGHDVRIAIPKYSTIVKDGNEVAEIHVPFDRKNEKVIIELMNVEGTPVYLLKNSRYFGGKSIYEKGKKGILKFVFFSMVIIELIKQLDFRPEVVHCNDWHAALCCVYLRSITGGDQYLKGVATVFTIHNLKYQGESTKSTLRILGLTDITASSIKQRSGINLMKGGIINSDVVNTVSETYAKEIQTKAYGFGLDPYLKDRKVYGILNGVDYEVWNPENDPFIYKKFNVCTLEGKKENKRSLLNEVDLGGGLDVPLIGMVTRLDEQKGLSLVANVLPVIARKEEINFILLGEGDPQYLRIFEKLQRKFGNVKVFLKFDEKLAHKIYAGSDIFLMPSLFEPCGLSQMISLKYGTIPIVRKTGGLSDSVLDFEEGHGKGYGFVFEKAESSELRKVIARSLHVYKNRKTWTKLMKRAMILDYSWESSAKKYATLYKKALATHK